MTDPAPTSWWPPRQPKAIAVAVVLTLLVVGLVAIAATGASVAYVGTLLVGCVTVGAFLASVLDRRRVTR